jgi:hypothetical protein
VVPQYSKNRKSVHEIGTRHSFQFSPMAQVSLRNPRVVCTGILSLVRFSDPGLCLYNPAPTSPRSSKTVQQIQHPVRVRDHAPQRHPRRNLFDAIMKPFQFTFLDHVVIMALLYRISYSFFEAFPFVWPGYGFRRGEQGIRLIVTA